MKQPGPGTRRSSQQLCPPVANEFAQIALGPLEFLNLLLNSSKFLFGKAKHALARDAAAFASTQNLRQFFQREPQLQSSLGELDRLHGRGIEYPVAALSSPRHWQNSQPLVVAQRVGADASQAGKFSRTQKIGAHHVSMNP